MSSQSLPTREDDLDDIWCCPGASTTIIQGVTAAPDGCTSSTPLASIPSTVVGSDSEQTDVVTRTLADGSTEINNNGGITDSTNSQPGITISSGSTSTSSGSSPTESSDGGSVGFQSMGMLKEVVGRPALLLHNNNGI